MWLTVGRSPFPLKREVPTLAPTQFLAETVIVLETSDLSIFIRQYDAPRFPVTDTNPPFQMSTMQTKYSLQLLYLNVQPESEEQPSLHYISSRLHYYTINRGY